MSVSVIAMVSRTMFLISKGKCWIKLRVIMIDTCHIPATKDVTILVEKRARKYVAAMELIARTFA